MLQLQTVEIVNRLRNAFGLRGKVDQSLDEVIIPTSLVMDATSAPFRSDGIYWAKALGIAANPATWQRVEVTPASSQTCVVKQIVITNINATIEQFRWGVIAGTYVNPTAKTTEAPPILATLPIDIQSAQGIAQTLTPTTEWGDVYLLANTSIVIPVDIMLQEGQSLAVEDTVVNKGVIASFAGYYFRPR